MDLEFSEEQQMLRDTTRRMLEQCSTIEVVRQLEDDPKGYPDELWKQTAELGLCGLTIAEEHGGAGMGALEAVVVYEEFGRALAPVPHFVSCVMSAGVLQAAGSDEQKTAWLPKIAAGEVIVTPAWLEPGNGYGSAGVQMKAERDGEDYVLSGTKLHVHFASSAEAFVVLVRTGTGAADVDLLLVDADSSGISMEQQLSLAADTQYKVTFDGVRVPAANRIGAEKSGWAAWNDVMHDGIILCAAQANGGAQRAMEITVQYSLDREQFGKPLGAFQAISHYLADGQTNVDGGTTLTYEAAWARANGRSIDRLAPMAKLFACQTYRDLTAMSEQVHGGMGFTIEYDIQLFFRRAKQLQLAWWDTRYLEALIAASVLDGEAA